MKVTAILDQLALLGSPDTKKIYLRHGAREPLFGVKVGDLKKIQKKIKQDHTLALGLYDTDNSDAMYLAGLICDPTRMTAKDLARWVKKAYWYMLSEYTVPWVAAESKIGYSLATEWIQSKKEGIAAAGWATFANFVAITADTQLDIAALKKLLLKVVEEIMYAENRVRYAMNGFIIAVGCFVAPLTQEALHIARQIGAVAVDMGKTSCKVPLATTYITKVQQQGKIGKKKKKARC